MARPPQTRPSPVTPSVPTAAGVVRPRSRFATGTTNRIPGPRDGIRVLRSSVARVTRFMSGLVVLGLVAVAAVAGQEAPLPVEPKPEAPLVFAGSNARTRANWQNRLVLGPNDVVNFGVYGRPDLARNGVLIGPDGRVSYLEAQGIQAAGLTLDELREAMTGELAKHHRRPRVIVTPGEFRSKRFYVLGKVVNKGAFTLERPLTVIEAVAQAGGLETGLLQLNTVELADLPRSFLIRAGRRVAVDFEKLFLHGDLSHNILLEPEDYLYFPSAVANEIYVLGSVKAPGAQGLTGDASVVGAVSLAGGFTERAYTRRVLVVRGALEAPERFVIDTNEILAAKKNDFRLQPRDIVYVSDRPWSRVEDLADLAATAFIQTMVTVWTGGNVGSVITSPLLPSIK